MLASYVNVKSLYVYNNMNYNIKNSVLTPTHVGFMIAVSKQCVYKPVARVISMFSMFYNNVLNFGQCPQLAGRLLHVNRL